VTNAFQFDHERLDVYKAALSFSVSVHKLSDELPKNRKHLADQLRRASASTVLNIAEGAGEWESKEKARFYRMARRSATECAAAIDILLELGAVERAVTRETLGVLQRIVCMLVKMIRGRMPGDGREGRGAAS
jgi:four helix bundle protein